MFSTLPTPSVEHEMQYISENGYRSDARVRVYPGRHWNTLLVTDTDLRHGWGARASAAVFPPLICSRWEIDPSYVVLVIEDLEGQFYQVSFPEDGPDPLDKFYARCFTDREVTWDEVEELIGNGN